MPSNTNKIIGAVVISAVLIIGAYLVLRDNQEDNVSSSGTPQSATDNSDNQTMVVSYADGTYSASGEYQAGGHTQMIDVELTIVDDVITSASVVNTPGDNVSANYQAGFDGVVKDEVENKKLDEADVSRLSGASLTSNAFNQMLESIRQQARS